MDKLYNNSDGNGMLYHGKSKSNFANKINPPQSSIKKVKKINLKNIKSSYETNNNVSKSSIITRNYSSAIFQEKKEIEHDTDALKKILINKINNQINDIIKGKENIYFNENNKIFFLGFCDILFELGFLHIKETEINDINKIKKQIKDLYTQPYTNRALLSESFLYNEQQLLISAWKTILNNFKLIKEFDSLPKENEEISIDDCKLFVFIVTGLFIGFNKNYNFDINLNSDRKVLMKNKSSNNFNLSPNLNKSKDFTKNMRENKLNQSYSKSIINSAKKSKYHFRKKSDISKSNNNSKFNNSINNNDDNILKKIL